MIDELESGWMDDVFDESPAFYADSVCALGSFDAYFEVFRRIDQSNTFALHVHTNVDVHMSRFL